MEERTDKGKEHATSASRQKQARQDTALNRDAAATQAAARTDPASQPQRETSEQQRVPLRAMVHECMQRWFRQTQSEAESGVAPMQTLLAQMYLSGYGVKADATKGKEWLKKAAERDGQARIMLRSINVVATATMMTI
ncbi:unnamed protein product [Closterium sp. Naga37s-1]|nr:unnamed protein product [Closterium sp. Naga37s-1]